MSTLIISDIDGVILNFSKSMKLFILKQFNDYISEDPLDWSYGLNKEKAMTYVNAFWDSNDFASIESYREILHYIKLLKKHYKTDLMFLTDIPERCREKREKNLCMYDLNEPLLIGSDKAQIIKEYSKKYDKVIFIDDKPENVQSVNELERDNVTVLYPIRGYNYHQLKSCAAKSYSTPTEFFKKMTEILKE